MLTEEISYKMLFDNKTICYISPIHICFVVFNTIFYMFFLSLTFTARRRINARLTVVNNILNRSSHCLYHSTQLLINLHITALCQICWPGLYYQTYQQRQNVWTQTYQAIFLFAIKTKKTLSKDTNTAR